MDEAERTRLSKRMSLVLRHRPDSVGLSLGSGGWVDLGDLVAALDRQGGPVTADDVRLVVETSDKRRFALADGRIRAHQGHSVEVDLDLPAAEPPDVLWHGTHEQALPAIRREGLRRMRRHHVHLSAVPDTARRVGARRGRPVLLEVEARGMHGDGHVFRVSDNGVWLVDEVPAAYLRFPD